MRAPSVSHLGRKTVVAETEMAHCYTPAFPYQRHFDGYIEMSEEDAVLFWEMDPNPTSKPWSEAAGPAPPSETVPTVGDIIPDMVTLTMPVPTSEPNDSRCVNVSAALSDVMQDTKPVEQLLAVCDQELTGATTEHIPIPRLLYLQATIGTQTEAMSVPEEQKMPELAVGMSPPCSCGTG